MAPIAVRFLFAPLRTCPITKQRVPHLVAALGNQQMSELLMRAERLRASSAVFPAAAGTALVQGGGPAVR